MSKEMGPVELPRELLEFYEGISRIQRRGLEEIRASQGFAVPEGWSREESGPLINSTKPEADPDQARNIFRQLLELLSGHKPDWAGETEKFAGINDRDFTLLIDSALRGEGEEAAGIVNRLEIHPEVANFALFHTVKPFLRVFAENAKEYIDTDGWLKNHCPVCGNKARIARLDSVEGKRYLHCPYCEMEWLFKLLCCPECGNEDHHSLAFLQIDETPGYGLHVCEQCKGYIKVIDEKNGGDPRLLSDAAATLYLDLLARQQGYRSETVNA